MDRLTRSKGKSQPPKHIVYCSDIRTPPFWGDEVPQNRQESRGFRDRYTAPEMPGTGSLNEGASSLLEPDAGPTRTRLCHCLTRWSFPVRPSNLGRRLCPRQFAPTTQTIETRSALGRVDTGLEGHDGWPRSRDLEQRGPHQLSRCQGFLLRLRDLPGRLFDGNRFA